MRHGEERWDDRFVSDLLTVMSLSAWSNYSNLLRPYSWKYTIIWKLERRAAYSVPCVITIDIGRKTTRKFMDSICSLASWMDSTKLWPCINKWCNQKDSVLYTLHADSYIFRYFRTIYYTTRYEYNYLRLNYQSYSVTGWYCNKSSNYNKIYILRPYICFIVRPWIFSILCFGKLQYVSKWQKYI